ncbi:2-aminoethylphosphonate ABC transporter substrate-binding protein, partial [Streptomyces sp. MBT67]|nr:2-aminoethylphosphonate ABC transporter substrate-binding protein [Streptomyces sp. MBT67]
MRNPVRIPARTLALPLAGLTALTLTACGGSSAASDAKSV